MKNTENTLVNNLQDIVKDGITTAILSAQKGKYCKRCTDASVFKNNAIVFAALLGTNITDYGTGFEDHLQSNIKAAQKQLDDNVTSVYNNFAKGGLSPQELITSRQLLDFELNTVIETGLTAGERFIYSKLKSKIARLPVFVYGDAIEYANWTVKKQARFASALSSVFFNGLLIPDFTQVCKMKMHPTDDGYAIYFPSKYHRVSHLSSKQLNSVYDRMSDFFSNTSKEVATITLNECSTVGLNFYGDEPNFVDIKNRKISYHGSLKVRNHIYYYYKPEWLTDKEKERYAKIVEGLYACQKVMSNPQLKGMPFCEYKELAYLDPHSEYERVISDVKRFPQFDEMQLKAKNDFFNVLILQDAYSREFNIMNKRCDKKSLL